MTCWTKLSCLLLVSMVKSSRSGAWFAPLVPKGGLVRTHVVSLAAIRFVDGVAEIDVRLDAVEKQIHQREPARARHEVLAVIGLCFDAFRIRAVEDAFRFVDQPFVAANEKAAGAAGGISNA